MRVAALTHKKLAAVCGLPHQLAHVLLVDMWAGPPQSTPTSVPSGPPCSVQVSNMPVAARGIVYVAYLYIPIPAMPNVHLGNNKAIFPSKR